MSLIVIFILIWAWKILNWLWFKPKRLEKLLGEQDFQLIERKRDFIKKGVKPILTLSQPILRKAFGAGGF